MCCVVFWPIWAAVTSRNEFEFERRVDNAFLASPLCVYRGHFQLLCALDYRVEACSFHCMLGSIRKRRGTSIRSFIHNWVQLNCIVLLSRACGKKKKKKNVIEEYSGEKKQSCVGFRTPFGHPSASCVIMYITSLMHSAHKIYTFIRSTELLFTVCYCAWNHALMVYSAL